jgi:hypothetical protein
MFEFNANFRWENSSNDPVIISANAEGSLKGYSVVSGTPRFSIESKMKNSHFLCFDLDSSSSSLVVGDNHGDLFFYDRLTLKMIHKFSRASWFSNGHFNRVIFSLSFNHPIDLLSEIFQ